MKKRILSLFLVAVMLVSHVPATPAQAHGSTDPEALIAKQYDAFIATLKPGGASEGPMELVMHSIGGGGNLELGPKNEITRTILHSALMRETVINTAASLCRTAGAVFGTDTAAIGGNIRWYQNSMGYSLGACVDNGNSILEDDPPRIPNFSLEENHFQGTANSYDEALFLVVGDSRSRISFQPQQITADTIRYRVTIRVTDTFDFNNSAYYDGDDQSLESFLTWVGKFLALGLLTTFDWGVTVEFDLEMPNLCAHTSHNYAWEFDGKSDLVSVASGEFENNPLTKWDGSVDETGQFQKTWYNTTVPMRLLHDRPWVLEFRCMGRGDFVLADSKTSQHGTHLRRNRNSLFFYTVKHDSGQSSRVEHFGRNYAETTGFVWSQMHTFVLENRVNPDGSNMVYLLVNGVELGAMDRFYSQGVYQGTSKDWMNGRDLIYGFIGSFHYPLQNLSLEYIKVWENGRDNGVFSYMTEKSVEPTCTADGGILNTCTLCGAEFLTDVVPATGHDFEDWKTVKEPSCTAEGQLERRCRTCGHRERKSVAMIDHDYVKSVTAPGCVEGGYTTYTCSCGDSYVVDYTDALGHDFTEWQVSEAPNCTESGLEERWCERCGHRERRAADPLGHRYTSEVIEPGCTVGGYTLHTCACGDSYRSDFTNPRGHRYEAVITEPGCIAGGFTTYTCDCGDSYRSDFTTPTGHRYEATVTEPGCTAGGYTTYSCHCGDSYRSDFTTPTGHRYEAAITEPGCTAGGYTTYTCHCGESYVSDYVNPVGHCYSEGVCARCGEIDPNYQKPVENPFTDVPQNSFYFEPVLWAMQNGITSGASADTFNPDGQCLRAQVVTFLWRAAGSPEPSSGENPFADVRETDFYYQAVLWAVEQGITTGADATHFNPLGVCNRAQVVTFLYRAFCNPAVESSGNPFSDVPASAWYAAPVLWAVEKGITNGLTADTFGPDSPCNRAQVVTFLYRAYN